MTRLKKMTLEVAFKADPTLKPLVLALIRTAEEQGATLEQLQYACQVAECIITSSQPIKLNFEIESTF